MSFINQIKDETKRCWEANLKNSPLWEKVSSRSITRKEYAAILRETYHYTKQSPLIQSSTLAHFQGKYRNLVKPFLKHAQEEEWHYKLAEKDIKNLGFDEAFLEASPLPITQGYLGFIFNRIAFHNPLSYLGYLFHLEYMAIELGPEFVEHIVKALDLNKNQLSFYNAHVEEDQDHVDDLIKLIDKNVTERKDQEEVLYTIKTAANLFSMMMNEAVKQAAKGEL